MKKSVVHLFLLASLILPALASGTKQIVKVEGMSCALCAAGLRHTLLNIPEVGKVEIVLKTGTATVLPKEVDALDPRKIWKGVIDSGFTPKELFVEGTGRILLYKGHPAFRQDRPMQLFLLVDRSGKLNPYLHKDEIVSLRGELNPTTKETLPTLNVLEIKEAQM